MSSEEILRKKPNESELEYHKRLLNAKLVDKTLDLDYSVLAPYLYKQEYSSDVARRMAYGSLRTLSILENETNYVPSDEKVLSEIDDKIVELRKEKQKFFDQRNAYNKIIRERARQEEINELIVDALNSGNLPTIKYIHNNIKCSDNDLLVSLNDIHYGANYSNYWGEYNSTVCRDMIATYLDEIIKIAERHGSENCIVWENGDAISGQIHRSIQITNKENVIEQVTGVSELIAEFLAELSKHFKTVKFASVSGNHSRIEPNKNDSLPEERLDDIVEWYLRARLQNFENIIIGADKQIDSTMYMVDIRGKKYLGVHGDMDGSYTKVQSLQSMVDEKLYAVLSGHMHHNKLDEVQGIKTVMAGSFLGVDSYCVQKRIMGKPQQMVCVCDDNGILCSYDINLR